MGKIQIVKTFGLSQYLYTLAVFVLRTKPNFFKTSSLQATGSSDPKSFFSEELLDLRSFLFLQEIDKLSKRSADLKVSLSVNLEATASDLYKGSSFCSHRFSP